MRAVGFALRRSTLRRRNIEPKNMLYEAMDDDGRCMRAMGFDLRLFVREDRSRNKNKAGCNAGTPPSDKIAASNPPSRIIQCSLECFSRAVLSVTSATININSLNLKEESNMAKL